MTFVYSVDANVGKVHRTRLGTQHYVIFGWRGKHYRLTGRFTRSRNDVLCEAISTDGSLLWSNEDGDHFPSFIPIDIRVWIETINWRGESGTPPF